MADPSQDRDQLLATLGHELRNPLAVIASAVQVIELTGGDSPAQRQAVQLLKRQVPELVRLVDALMEFSRLVLGRLRLVQKWIDLREVAARAAADVTPRFAARRQRLEHSSPPAPMKVYVDDQRIGQVLVHLLENASKFSAEGSLVRLELETDAVQTTIRVRDEGIGIGADLLPHVFEPFVQGAQPLDRAQGGVGLGLTLAHGLIRLHGGELAAVSEGETLGSEFIMKLPRTDPQG